MDGELKPQVVKTIPELREARRDLPAAVGLVPTMGYLHEGHLSLVRKARQQCASVIVSIFVNPTQFALNEDLDGYPRDIRKDLRLLNNEQVDLVWIPDALDMYPNGFQTWVQVTEITRPLEGIYRPTHFQGVTTVVAKLFNACTPHRAYFGQKDAQQVAVIRRMVQDLNFDLEIIVCPIVREADGLAMSSRNTYLNKEQRRAAAILFNTLTRAQDAFESGTRDAHALREIMFSVVNSEPLAQPQYVSCADPETLLEITGEIQGGALLSMAVLVGKTRLIDNILLDAG